MFLKATVQKTKPMQEFFLLYDVVSNYVIDAQIGSIGISKRDYAIKNLAHFSSICDEKDIVILIVVIRPET